MSADDWVVCPFCKKKRDSVLDELFNTLTREEYDKLLKLVEEHDLNADGIKYVIDEGYLNNEKFDEEPEFDESMKIRTMRVDYDYGINYEEIFFWISFDCSVCGFNEVLESKKKVV